MGRGTKRCLRRKSTMRRCFVTLSFATKNKHNHSSRFQTNANQSLLAKLGNRGGYSFLLHVKLGSIYGPRSKNVIANGNLFERALLMLREKREDRIKHNILDRWVIESVIEKRHTVRSETGCGHWVVCASHGELPNKRCRSAPRVCKVRSRRSQ